MINNQNRFGLYVFGLLSVSASVVILISLLQGGLISYIKIIALLFPFGFMMMLSLRPYWHVAYFALITANSLVIPIYGLERFTPLLLVLGASSIAVTFGYAINKSMYGFKLDVIDKWVAILGAILIGRFICDRPGFVGFGAASGGFMSALTLVSPVVFYFIMRPVIAMANLTRKQIKIVLVMSVITIFSSYLSAEKMFGLYIGRYFMGPSSWLFCATILTLYATSSSERRRNVGFYIWMMFFLAAGVFGGFRSRIFFFIGEIALVAKLTGRLKRAIGFASVAGVLGFGAMMISGKAPAGASRVLSLFTTVEVSGDQRMGGAMGWVDNFRLRLYELAWDDIVQNPLVGQGFNLVVSEALEILSVVNKDTQVDFLAMSGAYHNSIVVLAVKAGLPAAIIFTFIWFMIPFRLYRQLRAAPASDVRTWGIVLMAFWVGNSFMLLMNGGPNEFFASMILNGLMASISRTKINELAPRKVIAVDIESAETSILAESPGAPPHSFASSISN